ncbi:TetR/AcrR family transcriptional regulator [Rhizohabitans arisaemae]|uniref:TetR/AcrR family transcriptional regulator n=1 Tax=Rhizohabitans arisaemae TaxID=2720610 RepID=UPI0024B05E4E|nr:TetR/AcrR family transcriptional regulator [Rhizohabitans arisaemae]
MEPQNARSRRTGAALLQAARELIEADGFEGLTMQAVAERAGVSRRGVYLHFSSRTDLVTALYRDLGRTEEVAASLQAVWDSPDGRAALTEWAAHIARSHPRILAIMAAVDHARRSDADAAELWETAQSRWLMGCTRLMRWLADEDSLAECWTVETAADMMWALMSPDLLTRLLSGRGWSRQEVADHLGTLFRATFLRQEQTP